MQSESSESLTSAPVAYETSSTPSNVVSTKRGSGMCLPVGKHPEENNVKGRESMMKSLTEAEFKRYTEDSHKQGITNQNTKLRSSVSMYSETATVSETLPTTKKPFASPRFV